MIGDFLSPVPDSVLQHFEESHPQQVYSNISIHQEIEGLPELKGARIAMLGVMEDRGALGKQGM